MYTKICIFIAKAFSIPGEAALIAMARNVGQGQHGITNGFWKFGVQGKIHYEQGCRKKVHSMVRLELLQE